MMIENLSLSNVSSLADIARLFPLLGLLLTCK